MVLMVVLVLKLEVIMNNNGIDEEDKMGFSVRSFCGIYYVKKPVVSLLENIFNKSTGAEVGGSGRGPLI